MKVSRLFFILMLSLTVAGFPEIQNDFWTKWVRGGQINESVMFRAEYICVLMGHLLAQEYRLK